MYREWEITKNYIFLFEILSGYVKFVIFVASWRIELDNRRRRSTNPEKMYMRQSRRSTCLNWKKIIVYNSEVTYSNKPKIYPY